MSDDEYSEPDGYDFSADEDSGADDYMAEIGAYERTGGGMLGTAAPDIGGGIAGSLRGIRDAKESFEIQVDATARSIGAIGVVGMGQEDINYILSKSEMLDNISYKNPACFVLGYLVSNAGNGITQERFALVRDRILPHVRDDIDTVAVLRYGRLWTDQLS